MLSKFFVYLRVGPTFFLTLQYVMLVGGVAFVALTVFSSLFIPEDEELKFSGSSAWRRESQTLTGHRGSGGGGCGTPIIRVPMPAEAVAAGKEMNTYYCSPQAEMAAAARLNDDLCGRLDVVHEVSSLRGGSCTGSDYDDDDEDDVYNRIV